MIPMSQKRTLTTVCFVFISILLINQSKADDFANALEAMSLANYRYSADLWSKLSQQGNLAAEYNLAISLKKIPGIPATDRQWLKSAARDGLVTAYSRLQPESIKPYKYVSAPVAAEISPEEWVKMQNPRYYTLQLASSTNRTSLETFYKKNNLQGKAGLYKNVRQGETRYTLVYGVYSSAAEARAAIDTLPKQLRKWRPWVRNIKDVHKIIAVSYR